jgi:DNA transposition AAA+ family ATPase
MNEGEAKTEVWTKEEIAAIREEARQYLADSGMSRQALGKAIDWSPASVSRWLTNDYTGDSGAIAQAVAGFLARQEEKAAAPPLEGPFAMTRQAAEILPVLNYAHVHGTFGVIVGPSGNGKTAALKHYAAANAGVVLLTIHTANHALSEVIHQLFELLGKPGSGRGTLGGLSKRLTAKLAGSGRLLIIDEAQFLDHRTVEALRAVHEGARIGLILAGMPRMYRDLVGNTVELWEQIRTRVGIRKRLSPFGVDDAERILRALDPRVSPEVCRMAWDIGKQCGRSVTHLYHHAARAAAAQRRPVTPADLLAAQAFLYEAPTQPAPVQAPPARPAPAPAREASSGHARRAIKAVG